MASVVAGGLVYASAPVFESAKAATEALTPADASHRKDDADTRNDEGERGEFSTNEGQRILLGIGATAGNEASSISDMVTSRIG